MNPQPSDITPLLETASNPLPTGRPTPPKPQRTVTFNPTVLTSSPRQSAVFRAPSASGSLPVHHGGQPTLSSLNNKLRRRNSSGAPYGPPPLPVSKIGPQRTTKTAQKLKLLPDPEQGEEGADEESGREVYAQFTRIKDPTARRDAARLGKADRDRLPRVTAYCTASSYRMDDLMRFLRGKAKLRGANPKRFDECVYSPYNYGEPGPEKVASSRAEDGYSQGRPRRYSDSALEVEASAGRHLEEIMGVPQLDGEPSSKNDHGLGEDERPQAPHRVESDPSGETIEFDIQVHTPEVFLFEYGTVVIWGMTLQEERRFLKEIARFEVEKLDKDDIETEEFNFYYTQEYQARIYNDFISLRDKKNYMTKLAISHALSQSVKTSLFEDLVDQTIEETKDIPSQIAQTGKINLNRKQINMQIGELFVLRISIHLQGSVLDAPELMWAEPQLDPIYQAVRSYLEVDQRSALLRERLDVIGDLLAVLKDQLTVTHGEFLEWIVIILILFEVVVAAINIVVDLRAGE